MRRQRVAIALSAGEHADALENFICRKQKTTEQAAQLGLARAAERQSARSSSMRAFGIEFFVLILREVIGLDVVAERIFARRQRLAPGQQFDQRRFACAVHADQRDPVAALDSELTSRENFFRAVALGARL